MTQVVLEEALPRLRRALGLGEEVDDASLEDALKAAEEEILRYLNQDTLPEHTDSLVIELAALKYLQGQNRAGVQEESYAEGQLSQSQRYYSPQEFEEETQALLRTLAPYRRVVCKGAEA